MSDVFNENISKKRLPSLKIKRGNSKKMMDMNNTDLLLDLQWMPQTYPIKTNNNNQTTYFKDKRE